MSIKKKRRSKKEMETIREYLSRWVSTDDWIAKAQSACGIYAHDVFLHPKEKSFVYAGGEIKIYPHHPLWASFLIRTDVSEPDLPGFDDMLQNLIRSSYVIEMAKTMCQYNGLNPDYIPRRASSYSCAGDKVFDAGYPLWTSFISDAVNAVETLDNSSEGDRPRVDTGKNWR